MGQFCRLSIIILLLSICCKIQTLSQTTFKLDTITFKSGNLHLKALVWSPRGNGPFQSIIFCHGNYGGTDTTNSDQIYPLGPLFAENGYLFFVPFRRGVGLSSRQGSNSAMLMEKAFKEKGIEGRNEIQLQQLETHQLEDMKSAVASMCKRKEVDTSNLILLGHSFGGSLAILLAEQDHRFRSIVLFSPAGYSWDHSPILRNRLLVAVKNIHAPVMIVQTFNDYSTKPGFALDSALSRLNQPHQFKIYPKYGYSAYEGHNFIFLNSEAWKTDVFRFLINQSIHR